MVIVGNLDLDNYRDHSEYFWSNVEETLRSKKSYSDLIIVTRSEDRIPHEFQVHQAMVLPHSKLLKQLVNQHALDPYCPKEVVKVHFEIGTEVMNCIMQLLYTGAIKANQALLKKVMEGLKTMGINLLENLDFALWLDKQNMSSEHMKEVFSKPGNKSNGAPSRNMSNGKKRKADDGMGIPRKKTKQASYPFMLDPTQPMNAVSVIDDISCESPEKSVFQCQHCSKEFRYNIALNFHRTRCGKEKTTGHPIESVQEDLVKIQSTKKKDTALPQDNSMNGSNQFSSFFSPKSASKKSTALMSAKKGSPQTKSQQIRALKPGSSLGKPSPHTPTTPHYFLGHKTKQAILTDMLKNVSKISCPKCNWSSTKIVDLRLHIAAEHFSQQIKAVNVDGKCRKCDLDLGPGIIEHVAVNHAHAIKFFLGKEGLAMPSIEAEVKEQQVLTFSFDPADYPCKALRVDVKNIRVETLKQCYLCMVALPQDREGVLLHFLQDDDHYRLELVREHCKPTSCWGTSQQCPDCSEVVPDQKDFLVHIVFNHDALLKHIPGRYRIPPLVEESSCLLPSQNTRNLSACCVPECGVVRADEMSLNVHIIMAHLIKPLDSQYKKAMKTGPVRCPATSCNTEFQASTQKEDRHNFYKHIFSHSQVKQKYLDKL